MMRGILSETLKVAVNMVGWALNSLRVDGVLCCYRARVARRGINGNEFRFQGSKK
jgi:hypothetical protein